MIIGFTTTPVAGALGYTAYMLAGLGALVLALFIACIIAIKKPDGYTSSIA